MINMSGLPLPLVLVCGLFLWLMLILLINVYIRKFRDNDVMGGAFGHRIWSVAGRQENDVWNISGRVHNHEQWPTHDHHISIDSYVFPSESKDPRLAPPAYSEVGLPTYEEAINASNSHKATTLPAPVHTVVQIPRENS